MKYKAIVTVKYYDGSHRELEYTGTMSVVGSILEMIDSGDAVSVIRVEITPVREK